MMETTMEKKPAPKWRKHVLGLGLGALVGMVGGYATMRVIDSGVVGDFGASQIAATLMGLIFVLTALGVGVGLVSPSAGAKFLNVEDADELRDQRRMLSYSAVSMILWGGLLFLLAAAGPQGVVPATLALAVALLLLGAVSALTTAQWKLMDELLRNVASEGGNIAFYLTLVIGGGWAILAHLTFVAGPGMLDWVTLLSVVSLVGTSIAAARRGMLSMR